MTIIKGARRTPDDYDLIERGAAVPAAADMCIIHGDDTMEPYIRRGERVYIRRRQTPAEMEAGLFLYRGKVYSRQWCEDYAGRLHLLCANPARERENLHLSRSERSRCLCLGRVLLDKKLPAPVYGAGSRNALKLS